MIGKGADVNSQDKKGWSSLHFAAQAYNEEIAMILFNNGAIVDAQEANGNTALGKAVFSSQGRGDVIKLLLSHGANKSVKNKSGMSPADLADSIANFDAKQILK